MKKLLVLIVLTVLFIQSATSQTAWREELARKLPEMGHRNWILVVDAAYPLQSNPGITTFVTNEDQLVVLKEVLDAIKQAPHVSPDIFLDQEIDFVPEEEVSGIKKYKKQLDRLIEDEKVSKVLHEQLIEIVDEAAQSFQIVVLKTNMTVPYTSVFVRLDCGYWDAEQEQQMRKTMN